MAHAAEGFDVLRITGLDSNETYRMTTKKQRLFIKRFGGLVKHILPIELNPNGLILRIANRHYSLTDCVETYEGDGDLFAAGVDLNNQFIGSYYNENTRLLGDFGSSLYVIERLG